MSVGIAQRLRDASAGLSQERVALSQLADLHGPGAPGSLLMLLAAPCLLPVPGVGTVLGLGIAMLALALWRGQAACTLPQRVGDLQLPLRWARRVLTLLARVYERASRLARQRLPHLADVAPRSWLAAQVGSMALLIVLPIPFGNVLPALALMLLGLGLVFRDGVAVLLAAGTAAAALAFTAGLGLAAWWWGVQPLTQWLQA